MPLSYDPFDASIVADPYPVYEALRDDAPVHWAPDTGTFVLSRYDDVAWALGAPDLLSSDAMRGVLMGMPTGTGTTPLPRETANGSIVSVDPPDHTEMRRVVNRGFTPRRIAEWDARIEELVAEHLDRRPADRPVDVVGDLAAPLPVQVIAELLGADPAMAPTFRAWADASTQLTSGSARTGDLDPSSFTAAMEMVAYLTESIAARGEDPGDDLIGTLLRARDDAVLAPQEAVGFAGLLLFAGTETTTNLIGNAAWALLEHPDELAAVAAAPARLAEVVEEVLRWEAPVQYVFRRATRAFERHGVEVPVDGIVTLVLGAANRDPRRFGDDAHRFVPGRAVGGQLAFGFGPHFCLGASLARSEALAALRALVPLLVAAGGHQGADDLIDSMQFRGRRSLVLRG